MKNSSQLWNTLLHEWPQKALLIFLDYDGTLTPIVSDPQEAFLPQENRVYIEGLVKTSLCQLVIISGRSLEDIKSRVAIENIIYVGNHGWEIDGPDIHFESLVSPDIISAMESIKYELAAKLSHIEGAFVEDKGMTLSVHYRQVSSDKEVLVKQISHQIWQDYQKQNRIRITSGKKVLEVKPPLEWDKGKAALWLLRKQEILKGKGNVLPIYIGDDKTDEDAFRALKGKGITVAVAGEERCSGAEYCLQGPEEVMDLLKHMTEWAYEKL